jgi:hypothetical protein
MMNYNFAIYRNQMLWTRTLTQVKAVRLVNELLRQGFVARYERLNPGVK